MSDESFCEVSLGDYDGDPATFYDEVHVKKCRKAHKCYECDEAIPVGAAYVRVSGKWEGEVMTHHFCEACWEISGEFSEGGGRTFGITWDTFENEWDSGATLQGCLNRLTSKGAKELMTRKWKKFKGLEDK